MYPMNGFTGISHSPERISCSHGPRPPRLSIGNDYFKLCEINLSAISTDAADYGRAINSATISCFKAWYCVFDVWKRTKAEYAETVSTFHSSRPTDALYIVNIKGSVFILDDELSLVWVNWV